MSTFAMTRGWMAVCMVVMAGACGGANPDVTVFDAGTTDAPGFYRSIPVTLNRDLDVLFLVDNSGSMLAEQQQLTANFPGFINVIQQVPGGLPNIHLGVLSSNVGAAGVQSVPGCPPAGDDGNLLTGPPGNTCSTQFGLTGSFISDIAQSNGSRMRNHTGALDGLFTCMASLGTSGCGYEMHLESMYRALQPGKNPGFLRTAAHLAVIILADEDDCSTEMGAMFGDPNAGISSQLGPRTSFRCHEFGVRCQNDPNPRTLGPKTGCAPDTASQYMYEVQRYVDFLRNLKQPGAGAEVVVAGIIGNFDRASGSLMVGPDRRTNDPNLPEVVRSCFTRDPNDPDDGASPPVRIGAFLSAFRRGTQHTVCNDNLSNALIDVGTAIKNAIGNPCIDAVLADENPAMAGLQPTCTVVDVVNPDAPNRAETPVPACESAVQTGTCTPGSAATPCWCLRPDVARCPPSTSNPSSYALEVFRAGATPPAGAVVEVFCRVP